MAPVPHLGFLSTTTQGWSELQSLCSPQTTATVNLDGKGLTISQLVATARYGSKLKLGFETDKDAEAKINAAVKCLNDKLEAGESLYGINTGFGGSADSRTNNPKALQLALLQHQQAGILELPDTSPYHSPSGLAASLNLSDEKLSMPEAWVRAAIAVRLNSLVRGHSGVRTRVLQTMAALLEFNITPVVPVRGSISASGDLSPLSYIAGCLTGEDGILVWVDGPNGTRIKVPSSQGLAQYNLEPIEFHPKEALGILNGTAVSAGLAALVLHDAANLALLTHITTAMAVEASTATDASFAAFIGEECRPHPGQIESASTIFGMLKGSKLATHLTDEGVHLLKDEDEGSLRQDRYPLRTASQFLGPLLEDILASWKSLNIELNSTTDNPLISVSENTIHHGGNFQASSVTSAVEKTRLALALLGKITFAQATEMINPAMNRGLNANLSATDPSLNFHCKGVDIALAAVTSELQFLGSPVSTYIQPAEMSNQAVNSLALISARYTVHAINTLQQLLSYTLYLLCQAFDLRALQRTLSLHLQKQISESISKHFSTWIDAENQAELSRRVFARLQKRMDETSARDLEARLMESYQTAGFEILKFFASLPSGGGADPLRSILKWRNESAKETWSLYRQKTLEFLETPTACHASPLLGSTRPMYEFIRRTLGVGMHGIDNYHEFSDLEAFKKRPTIGEGVSVILESLRNGDLFKVMFEGGVL